MHAQNKNQLINDVNTLWEDSIIPTLVDYIKIPNKSPLFDAQWETHGFMDQAVALITAWCEKNRVPGMIVEVIRLPQRTPVIFIDIPGLSDETILLYGHLDKQPEMSGWDEGLGPWTPVIKEDKLYGRGGADDGYATFASLAAIKSLHAQNIPHARCVILIEACEESGSYDLPFYIEALEDRIGNPNLVICLDSGCGNYDQLWVTTSLRGMIGGELSIKVLTQGIHSGNGGGITPSCFLVLRQLLSRIEDEMTGIVFPDYFNTEIPAARIQQAEATAYALGTNVFDSFPFQEGVQPLSGSAKELILNRTWRPALAVIGADGLPPTNNAGNVSLPFLNIKLSMRLPPNCSAEEAALTLKKIVENNPPFNAQVTFDIKEKGSGWDAPAESPWLSKAIEEASETYFGKKAMYMGEGGSIPFMGMLGKKFPIAQFLITGVLGPASNAHGPNEFLHLPTGKKLTCCVATIIAKHYTK